LAIIEEVIMLGKEKAKEIIDGALSYSTAEEKQVTLFAWD